MCQQRIIEPLALALDFSGKSNYLVRRGVISEYKTVVLFLQAFGDKSRRPIMQEK